MPRTLAENAGYAQGVPTLLPLILQRYEDVASRRVEALRELVVAIEDVVPPRPDRPLAIDRVEKREVQEAIAVHPRAVRFAGTVEARAARDDFGPQGPRAGRRAQGRHAVFLGPPRQQQARRLVHGILQG